MLYADCGTGGELDRVLAEEGVERIGGPHCYAFYAGQKLFEALAEAEPGTFYLTDFLARQFETLVIEGLGLDRHPELLPDYFGNYSVWSTSPRPDDAGAAGRSQGGCRAARAGLRVPVHRARRTRRVRRHRLREFPWPKRSSFTGGTSPRR